MILTMSGGGAERQLAYLAPELSRRGHDVHLAVAYAGSQDGHLDGVTLHRVASSRKYDPRVFMKSWLLLRRLRPDVVQTWLTHMDIMGGSSAWMLHLPWVLSERSAALSYPSTWLNRMRVAVGKRADLIVPNSRGGADYWESLGVSRSRIEIVPNFVPQAEIDSAPPLIDSRIADDDELIIHVGRLSPEKNLDLLIEALQHVVRVRPHAKLAFCGDGPLLGHLTARVRGAQLTERVFFPGFVTSVGSWLKRSSAAVAVSLCEGHPNAILEAMAANVPVAVSDIPAYRSILSPDAAFFVDGKDAVAIATGIIKALENRTDAEARSKRARSALANQSIAATAARYERVYQTAIELAASRRKVFDKAA
jgi:glycosyltransferase involved in cell wall biosynthesis